MQKLFLFILFFCLASCSLWQVSALKGEAKSYIKNICLDGEGAGRLEINGRKYPFSYETLWEKDDQRYSMSMHFPLLGEESIDFDLSYPKNHSLKNDFYRKMVAEKGVDPILLEQGLLLWANLVSDVAQIKLSAKNEPKNQWQRDNKQLWTYLMNKGVKLQAEFRKLDGDYFTENHLKIFYGKKLQEKMSVTLIVRKCFAT